MPDSYGRPLWTSPRLRCDRSHAAPIVTKTNPTDTTANPTTYQIAGNRSSLPFLGPGAGSDPAPSPGPGPAPGASLPLVWFRLVHPVGGTLHVLVQEAFTTDRPSPVVARVEFD